MDVVVGYAGGQQDWPTYRNIKDHTEAVRITFHPQIISYEDLLEHFFDELGGPPVSPAYSRQYRNAILPHNEKQHLIANRKLQEFSTRFDNRKLFIDVEDATDFYRAEEYHQKYIEKQSLRP